MKFDRQLTPTRSSVPRQTNPSCNIYCEWDHHCVIAQQTTRRITEFLQSDHSSPSAQWKNNFFFDLERAPYPSVVHSLWSMRAFALGKPKSPFQHICINTQESSQTHTNVRPNGTTAIALLRLHQLSFLSHCRPAPTSPFIACGFLVSQLLPRCTWKIWIRPLS